MFNLNLKKNYLVILIAIFFAPIAYSGTTNNELPDKETIAHFSKMESVPRKNHPSSSSSESTRSAQKSVYHNNDVMHDFGEELHHKKEPKKLSTDTGSFKSDNFPKGDDEALRYKNPEAIKSQVFSYQNPNTLQFKSKISKSSDEPDMSNIYKGATSSGQTSRSKTSAEEKRSSNNANATSSNLLADLLQKKDEDDKSSNNNQASNASTQQDEEIISKLFNEEANYENFESQREDGDNEVPATFDPGLLNP